MCEGHAPRMRLVGVRSLGVVTVRLRPLSVFSGGGGHGGALGVIGGGSRLVLLSGCGLMKPHPFVGVAW